MQYGYSPFVVREACGDRHQAVNDNNLFDMDSKFAEVVLEEEMMTMIDGLKKLGNTKEIPWNCLVGSGL
jgi:maleamate amidohydrolase